jgi:dTDP-4-dehydrorhamnose reductase
MRLFVIGAEGQVARSLREAATSDKDIVFGNGARPDVDLLRPISIESAIADFRPDVVVNPAAYTAVDKAETEPEQAYALNRDGARAVAKAAARLEIPVIHLSTDYVFDGKNDRAYTEQDAVAPQSVYGCSKLAGELAVAEANPKYLILRTSWVYAPFGNNFVRTMLRLAAERDRLRVVDDQLGSPTYAPDIADTIITIAKKMTGSGWNAKFGGVTHLAGPDSLSWCAFAREIIQESANRGGRFVPIDPISTSDYPTPAARPANSRLSTARLQSIFGLRLPSMKHSLANCLNRLRNVE